MPGLWSVGFSVFTILLAGGVAVHKYLGSRPAPGELERRRRVTIYRNGKMGDGEIIDIDGASIVYSYSVAGVSYTAYQDLTDLPATLPPDPVAMIGPVAIRFDPRNPANSIVMCEEWSGVRKRAPRSLGQGA
jgi:hypothetical protein